MCGEKIRNMKRYILLLAILVITLVTTAQTVKNHCYSIADYFNGDYKCEDSYDDWVLVFEDNFDGSTLNTDLWTTKGPSGQSWYCEDDPSYNTLLGEGNNHVINNGKLKLIARDDESGFYLIRPDKSPGNMLSCDGVPYKQNEQWFEYTSGWIRSNQKFVRGKFEIRCKIPAIKRLWPAFWLIGDCSQEIDIFEFMSENTNPAIASTKVTQTYHRKFLCDDEDKYHCTEVHTTSVNMSDSMHTYSVEWDELKLTWKIDNTTVLIKPRWANSLNQAFIPCGELYGTYIEDKIYPLDTEPMSIVANLRVKENSTATFPAEMEIDYIKVYQRIDSQSSVEICANSDIKGSTMAGQEINVGGTNCTTITIEDGEYLTLAAKDNITINSDFIVEEGAIFSMKIDN